MPRIVPAVEHGNLSNLLNETVQLDVITARTFSLIDILKVR